MMHKLEGNTTFFTYNYPLEDALIKYIITHTKGEVSQQLRTYLPSYPSATNPLHTSKQVFEYMYD